MNITNVIEIIGADLFEAFHSKYMSKWQSEIIHKGNVFNFDCVGNSQWEVKKNGECIDIYSFNLFEDDELVKELSRILELT